MFSWGVLNTPNLFQLLVRFVGYVALSFEFIGSLFVVMINVIFADEDQLARECASLRQWDGFEGECLVLEVPAFGHDLY